ncbi:hypothetical protein [Acidocella sp.]|uniref:hypothetical protein n=1 Tax=Acidocella sp. TaxID=50710 RepID=UPI002602941B|nr:hypothetical protein [Acidocella sp.]
MDRLFGEAHCDNEGVIHGWCWNPATPTARIRVELLVRGHALRTVIASRFREDLRERGMGDGYHAFSLPLPAAVLSGGAPAALRAAESGTIFWQKNALKFQADENLTKAIAQLRQHVAQMAVEIGTLQQPRRSAAVALAMRAAAARLREVASH